MIVYFLIYFAHTKSCFAQITVYTLLLFNKIGRKKLNSLQNILPRETLFSPQMSSIWLAFLLCVFVTFSTFSSVQSAYFQHSPIFTPMLLLSLGVTCLLVRYWTKNVDINLARQKLAFSFDRDDSLIEQLVRVEARPTTG